MENKIFPGQQFNYNYNNYNTNNINDMKNNNINNYRTNINNNTRNYNNNGYNMNYMNNSYNNGINNNIYNINNTYMYKSYNYEINNNNIFNNQNSQNNYNGYNNTYNNNNNNYNYNINNNNQNICNMYNNNKTNLYNNGNNYYNSNKNIIDSNINFNNYSNNYNQSQNNIIQENQIQNNKNINELLNKALKCLKDENNINHYLYKPLLKNSNENKNIFTTSIIEQTSDPNVDKVYTFSFSSEYEFEYVDLKKIKLGEEQRTSVSVYGTNLSSKEGNEIAKTLEKFNMGLEDGQNIYDMIYVPEKKNNNENNNFFAVNFIKSIFIINFYDALSDYIKKNGGNNFNLYWFKNSKDEMKSFLEGKLKENTKDFIVFYN